MKNAVVILVLAIALCSAEAPKKQVKRGAALGYASGLGYNSLGFGDVALNSGLLYSGLSANTFSSGLGYNYASGLGYSGLGYSAGQAQVLGTSAVVDRHTTIHRKIGVPVAAPYAVPVARDVAVPVEQPYPVPVDRPYPVQVPVPHAVPVDKPVAVPVDRPYAVPVPQSVPVPVPHPVPVTVHEPVAVPVVRRVPVPVVSKVAVPVAAAPVGVAYSGLGYGFGASAPVGLRYTQGSSALAFSSGQW